MLEGTHCAPKLETLKNKEEKQCLWFSHRLGRCWPGLSSTCATVRTAVVGRCPAQRLVLRRTLCASFGAQEESWDRFPDRSTVYYPYTAHKGDGSGLMMRKCLERFLWGRVVRVEMWRTDWQAPKPRSAPSHRKQGQEVAQMLRQNDSDFPGSKQPILSVSVSCRMTTVYKALHRVQGSALVVLSPFTADPEAQRS